MSAEERCCPGHGSMAHVRGCAHHPEHRPATPEAGAHKQAGGAGAFLDSTSAAPPAVTPDAGDAGDTIRVTLTVDTDELREWAGRHADAGHHGVAHVLYKAASDGESLSEQALREARDAERAAWSMWLHSWMNAVGPTPPMVDDVAKALRDGPRPFGTARGEVL